MSDITVNLTLNGKAVSAEVERSRTLLRFLRDGLRLTGTKDGCSQGDCGACTVLVDGEPVKSCQVRVEQVNGCAVTTIEGLETNGRLHPLQEAFIKTGASQCGFCTPGMIMSSKALLDRHPGVPSRETVAGALNDHLCRCTGYHSIARAVELAARESGGMVPEEGGGESLPSYGPDCLGVSLPDQDGSAKVTGGHRFADDLYFPDMLYGALTMAPHSSAMVLDLDVEAARRLPGVALVLTAKDIPGLNRVWGDIGLKDQPVLIEDRVRRYGDIVAAVFARSPEIARKGARSVKVRYQVIPGVYDPEESLSDSAPLIQDKGNVIRTSTIKRGDVEDAFRQAAAVVENSYDTPFVEHAYLEPEAGVAKLNEEGGVTLWWPTQLPFSSRQQVAENLSLPPEKIRVIPTPAGGAFGGKGPSCFEIQVLLGLAAVRTGRPVKITLTRRESLLLSSKRHPFRLWYRTAAGADGKVLAVKARLLADGGAYASISTKVLEQSSIFATGPYYWPNIDIDAKAVYTNNCVSGAFRGFGIPQVHFALESQMDEMARLLNLDPIEFRLRNALDVGLPTATGQILDGTVPLKKTLLEARRVFPKVAPSVPGRRVGVGVACGWKNMGYGLGMSDRAGAIMEVSALSGVVLRVSAVDMGQGITNMLAQMAAAASGVDYRLITVVMGDTDQVPEGAQAIAQRQTYIVGNAVVEAARRFKDALLEEVACGWNVSADSLSIEGDSIVVRDGDGARETGRAPLLSEVIFKTNKVIRGEYIFQPRRTYSVDLLHEEGPLPEDWRNYLGFTFLTQVAVVEVDEESGRVFPVKIVSIHEVGKAMNPVRVRGQFEGSSVMGTGYALWEEYETVEGDPKSTRLGKCGIPRFPQAPEVEVHLVEEHDSGGPFGAKGVSEVALVPTAPAVANAVRDAVGVRVTSLPLTAGKVRAAILKARSKG